MSWTHTSRTTASRPISPRERFMALIAAVPAPPGGEQHVIFANCVLPESLTPDTLTRLIPHFQTAWLALRFEHPSIASTLSPDGSSIEYTAPTTQQMRDDWLKQTFIIDQTATSTHDLRTRLHHRASNSLTFAPGIRAILFAQSHWKTDGRAVFQLAGRFLALCNEPLTKLQDLSWGTELPRLVPSLAAIANLNPEPLEADSAALTQDALGFLQADAPTGQPLCAPPTAPSGRPRTEHLLLSESQTSALLHAARAQGISVSAAVHAAAALHNLSLVSWSGKEYKYSVHRDLRSRLPQPWSGLASAGGEMVTSSAATIPAAADFATAAHALEEHARRGFTDLHFARDEAMWSRILEFITSGKPEEIQFPLDTVVSSLGVVDPFFDAAKELTPDRVEMGGQGYTAMAGGWAYTFRGRLNVSVSFNEAYRSPESMRMYLEGVRGVLERELL